MWLLTQYNIYIIGEESKSEVYNAYILLSDGYHLYMPSLV